MKKTVLNVQGMKCGGCANTIEEAVKACAGVASVKAQHQQGVVEIEYEESVADLNAIRKVIVEKGFTPA
jgi:copper chaperone